MAVVFSPSGRELASGTLSGEVRIWDVQEHRLKNELGDVRPGSMALAFSPDGRLLAIGGGFRDAWLFDAHEGTVTGILGGHTFGVASLALGMHGRILVTASSDRVHLWNVAQRAHVGTLSHGDVLVGAVTVDPAGSLVATGGWSRSTSKPGSSLYLWDIGTGTFVAELEAHGKSIRDLEFHPGGRDDRRDSQPPLTASATLRFETRPHFADTCTHRSPAMPDGPSIPDCRNCRRTPSALWLLVIALTSCEPSPDELVERLGGDPETRADARQELLLAKERAVDPLLAALADDTHSAARPELVAVLASLMMRVDDPRIETALLERLRADPDLRVRARIARHMGLLRRDRAADSLLDALSDSAGEVRYQSLLSLGALEHKLDAAQDSLLRREVRALLGDEEERVQLEAMIHVERYVAHFIKEAQAAALQAQLAEAESLYVDALEYSPTSKRANHRLGRHYLDNGQEVRGLDLLRRHGMVLDVPRFSRAPRIDGDLSDAVWRTAARADSFYQFASGHLAPLPSEVRTTVYVGYMPDGLYLGFLCHDNHPDSLVVGRSQTGQVWFDDDVEFYCDPDFDHRTYCQIGFNSAGLVNHGWFVGGLGNRVETWGAEDESAVLVGEDFWSVEYRLIVDRAEFPRPQPGMKWGFNLVRVYRGSEYSQWVRTYGGNAHQPDDFGVLVFR